MTLPKDFKVVDLTHRLPGPTAGKIFCDLGAKVIKIEDEKFKDPFLSGLFNDSDDHFTKWYRELNSKKELLRFDFKAASAKQTLYEQLQDSHILLIAGPSKIYENLGVSKNLLSSHFPSLTVIELKAGSGKFKNLHDLNALANAGLLDMHVESKSESIIRPPFLPIAGITFGHWVVTKALAAKLANNNWLEASLEEATETILVPFKSSGEGTPRYLHNGKFPCYCLYKTFDSRALAIAAVEDKFWSRFLELFELKLTMEDRFDTSERVFKIISKKISQLNSNEILSVLENEDICISLV
ncbi:MAG: hypothetical protein CME70_15790 [Halobacteriovorax sp.]|nr:hypothetical protein [Halobacteriovorax sp.]|tara:strand:+ start:25953 stop:26846 length:894 start_codon:yes stop_codon:yes gene_type:complete